MSDPDIDTNIGNVVFDIETDEGFPSGQEELLGNSVVINSITFGQERILVEISDQQTPNPTLFGDLARLQDLKNRMHANDIN